LKEIFVRGNYMARTRDFAAGPNKKKRRPETLFSLARLYLRTGERQTTKERKKTRTRDFTYNIREKNPRGERR
jgi:hypothetical protein